MKPLLIIPTYNEKENIQELIRCIRQSVPDLDILIIDDNSPDGTGEIAEKIAQSDKKITVFHRPGKLGLGSAYTQGFKYALEKGYDCVLEMDADFSHDPRDLPRFLEMVKHCDIVIGSRYTDGISVINWPMKRLMLSYFANKYASIVTGVPIRDLTGGYKCIRTDVLKSIGLETIKSDGYAFQIEVTVKAWYKGFKIVEIPIVFVERREGQSKMNKKIIWEAFWMVWRLRFENLFKKPTGKIVDHKEQGYMEEKRCE